MTTDTGKCRYCNQITYLKQPVTKDESEEAASLQCNCFEGKAYRRRIERIEKTNDNIDEAFLKDYPEMAELLKAAVPAILDGKLIKMSIDTGRGLKGVISLTAKGSLKVEKAISKKATYEE